MDAVSDVLAERHVLSERALLLMQQLPPLPAAYSQPTLTVHLTFEYNR